MISVRCRKVTFGDREYDELYLKHRWDNFDRPKFARKRADVIEKALGLSQGEAVLDAGCGIGTYTVELAKRGYNITGMDLSRTFLAEAKKAKRKAGVKAKLIRGDYNRVRFAGEFDAIFVVAAFFYRNKRSLIAVLKRLRRSLKPGGRILLDHPNPPVWSQRCPILTCHYEGDGIITQSRSDYLPRSRQVRFFWAKVDANRWRLRTCIGQHMLLPDAEFRKCMTSARFKVQRLIKKDGTRFFDPKRDAGFFVVAARGK